MYRKKSKFLYNKRNTILYYLAYSFGDNIIEKVVLNGKLI